MLTHIDTHVIFTIQYGTCQDVLHTGIIIVCCRSFLIDLQ